MSVDEYKIKGLSDDIKWTKDQKAVYGKRSLSEAINCRPNVGQKS